MIPMGLFGRPRVVAGFISGFCVQFALMAGVTYLPRLLQESMGIAAAPSGAALIPMTLALMLGSNVSGALFRKSGRLRAIALTSSFVIFAVAAAFIVRAQSLTAPLVTLLAAALGLGVGVGMPVSNLSAQTGADARDAGKATSTAMFFRGFGGTVSHRRVRNACPRCIPCRHHLGILRCACVCGGGPCGVDSYCKENLVLTDFKVMLALAPALLIRCIPPAQIGQDRP